MRLSRSARSLVGVTALTAVGVLALAAGPASAAPAQPGVATTNRAGYGFTPVSAARYVSAAWVQPTVACGAAASYADFRIELSRGNETMEVGTSANCRDGSARNFAWVGWNGSHGADYAIRAGDHMRMSLDGDIGGSYEYSIVDVTQGWGVSGTTTGGGGHPTPYTRATIAVRARSGASGALPLTNFHRVTFSHCTVNRRPLGGEDHDRFLMTADDGTVKVAPAAFSDEHTFSARWMHS